MSEMRRFSIGEHEQDAARYARSDNLRGRDIWCLTREALGCEDRGARGAALANVKVLLRQISRMVVEAIARSVNLPGNN
jgi:hypothetical protein